MDNLNRLISALSVWGFNVAASALPKLHIPTESPIGKFMYGILGVDPAKYNIWKELGFLAEPTIQMLISPIANRFLSNIPDEQIPEIADKYADAFLAQAEEKGSVNLFGIEIGPKAFEGLKELLSEKFNE